MRARLGSHLVRLTIVMGPAVDIVPEDTGYRWMSTIGKNDSNHDLTSASAAHALSFHRCHDIDGAVAGLFQASLNELVALLAERVDVEV